MSTAVLAAAALLVLYNSSDLALKTCICGASESGSEPGEEMETLTHDPSSNFVRMQRKISSIGLIGCLFPSRSNGSTTRSFGRRRRQPPNSTQDAPKEKPKYVHTPQYAADSHVRTTTPIPFSMRPLSQDANVQPARPSPPTSYAPIVLSSEIIIQPVKTNAQLLEEEQAKKLASQGGRVHLVGVSAS